MRGTLKWLAPPHGAQLAAYYTAFSSRLAVALTPLLDATSTCWRPGVPVPEVVMPSSEFTCRSPSLFSLVLMLLATGSLATACADPPTSQIVATPCTGVYVDLPPAPRAWDTSDVALVTVIASESGHAVVAFKEPTSAHMLKTGCRDAVSVTTVNAGLDMLRAQGVEIVDLYDVMGAAHVRMDAALAPGIRANALVDYIEPRQWLYTD
jgi:hypothetical protein